MLGYLSTLDVAERLNVTDVTVRAMVSRGELIADLIKGKRVYFLESTIQAYEKFYNNYLSTAEVAKVLGVSIHAINGRVRTGVLKYSFRRGKMYYFDKEYIISILNNTAKYLSGNIIRINQYDKTGKANVFIETKQNKTSFNFWVDIKDIDVIMNKSWFLSDDYVMSARQSLHQELAEKYLGYYPSCIDHINGVKIDNTDENLNIVTNIQNIRNSPSLRYRYEKRDKVFRVQCVCNYSSIYKCSVRTEDIACKYQFELEKTIYADYNYDFFKDRRNDIDILEEEYKGVITTEEATFKHIMRYAKNNAWYVYRYNLFDYFKDYNVPIPIFEIDSNGFMIDVKTKEFLNPFIRHTLHL